MSLDSLRKHAKTLLRRAHARSPDAVERVFKSHPQWRRFYRQKLANVMRLADAQLIVARELGFASWAQLKAAVANGEDVSEALQPENSYREIVDRVARAPIMEVVRCGTILSALPGRRPLENRGQPLSDQKLDALIWGLEHQSPKVRRFCLELLDNNPDDRALPKILACLDDAVPRVRWHAVHALSCDTCKSGVSLLTDEVRERLRQIARHDSSKKVRTQAQARLLEDREALQQPGGAAG
jgi:hypothetical protein